VAERLPANLGAGGRHLSQLRSAIFLVDTGTVLAPSIVNVSDSMLDHNEARGGTDQLGNGGDGLGGRHCELVFCHRPMRPVARSHTTMPKVEMVWQAATASGAGRS